MSDFTREVLFTPAFDKRHPDPSKNYGIGAMRVFFLLHGPKGIMQFVVGTGIYLPHVADELRARDTGYNPFAVQGWDIGYHSPVPQYEGQSPMKCEHLPGGECYYDGSSLQAEDFLPQFLEGGHKAVWAMLEDRYRDRFEESPR